MRGVVRKTVLVTEMETKMEMWRNGWMTCAVVVGDSAVVLATCAVGDLWCRGALSQTEAKASYFNIRVIIYE
jgi:hypothetical protein